MGEVQCQLDEGSLLPNLFQLPRLWVRRTSSQARAGASTKAISSSSARTFLQGCCTQWQIFLRYAENLWQVFSQLDERLLLQDMLQLPKLWLAISTTWSISTLSTTGAGPTVPRRQAQRFYIWLWNAEDIW